MSSPKDCSEKASHSILFNWDIIENCNEKHMINCAKYISKFIYEFNGITRAYHRLTLERDKSEKMYLDLIRNTKKSVNCQNCTALELKFEEQKSKLKTITNLLEQLGSDASSKNEDKNKNFPFEKVVTNAPMFTQMEDDLNRSPVNIDSAEKYSEAKRKMKSNDQRDEENVEKSNLQDPQTPQKRVIKKARKKSLDSSDDIEDQLSPILKKGRSSKKSLHDNANRPTPMKNLTNKFKSENISGLIEDDESIFEESNQSILNDSANENVRHDAKNKIVVKTNDSSTDCSIGLLQSHTKSTRDKNLKQGRLTFTKPRPKLSLNISQTKKFGGGLRNALDENNENVIKKEKEELQTQYDAGLNEDVDEIIESPSCLKLNPLKKYNLAKVRINDDSHANKSEDDDATLYIQPNIEAEEEKADTALEDLKKMHMKKSSKTSPIEVKPKRELLYREDPIRKKDDKKKVSGWSCTKCAEFYEVAFKGNSEMIKKKINQCSKHRGKFNPERQNTPPGFWDMNMPPIEDTEALNRANNKS